MRERERERKRERERERKRERETYNIKFDKKSETWTKKCDLR